MTTNYVFAAGVDKRGDASVDSEYKAAVHRASKPLSEWDPAKSMSAAGQTREPRTLEQCFELFSAIQQLGSDGYSCSACNEGEQLNVSFMFRTCAVPCGVGY